MSKRETPLPKKFDGVMVSSTLEDLEEHRLKIIDTINGQGMKAIAMEYDSSKPDATLISSSLDMVSDCAGYVCIIGYKYGQRPKCSKRNKKKCSLTELEFRHARRLDRPTLIFIMGEEHDVPKKNLDIRMSREEEGRFKDFNELVKKGAIYAGFDSLLEFERRAIHSVAELRWHLHYQEESRKRKRLLGLFEAARTGVFEPEGLSLTEFEEAILRYVANGNSETRGEQ